MRAIAATTQATPSMARCVRRDLAGHPTTGLPSVRLSELRCNRPQVSEVVV